MGNDVSNLGTVQFEETN